LRPPAPSRLLRPCRARTEGDKELGKVVDNVITVPAVPPLIAPVPVVVALHLFSYTSPEYREAIDKPRDLARA